MPALPDLTALCPLFSIPPQGIDTPNGPPWLPPHGGQMASSNKCRGVESRQPNIRTHRVDNDHSPEVVVVETHSGRPRGLVRMGTVARGNAMNAVTVYIIHEAKAPFSAQQYCCKPQIARLLRKSDVHGASAFAVSPLTPTKILQCSKTIVRA